MNARYGRELLMASSRAFLISIIILTALSGSIACCAQALPQADAVRIAEFYRLSSQIEDGIWPEWSKVVLPLLLITNDKEYLTRFPRIPEGFAATEDGFLVRDRQFPVQLQTTFSPFGPPSVIAIGEPGATASKTTTPWEITLMHEHFHQLQFAQPGYFEATDALGLKHGDSSGMWMLNYAFHYDNPEINAAFVKLLDSLLSAVEESDSKRFRHRSREYIRQRSQFLTMLSPDDRKYMDFQLWQEGVARYIQIMAAEVAATYVPTHAYLALPDYESFATYAPKLRQRTLHELGAVTLAKDKRVAFYSFGAVEGLLLDRLNPQWKRGYFKNLLTTEPLFAIEQ
jgi:hypothetical protein